MILNTPKGLFQKVGNSDDVGPLLCKILIFTVEAGPQTVVVLVRVNEVLNPGRWMPEGPSEQGNKTSSKSHLLRRAGRVDG